MTAAYGIALYVAGYVVGSSIVGVIKMLMYDNGKAVRPRTIMDNVYSAATGAMVGATLALTWPLVMTGKVRLLVGPDETAKGDKED